MALTAADIIHIEFPHLLVPLNAKKPNTTYGTVKTGEVSNDLYTEISFDVPANNSAAYCHLNFHINTSPVKGAPFALSGVAPYQFNIYQLAKPGIDMDHDTWNKHSPTGPLVGTVNITQDRKVDVQGGWVECNKGNVQQFIIKPSEDRALRVYWFELDYGEQDGGPHGLTFEMYE